MKSFLRTTAGLLMALAVTSGLAAPAQAGEKTVQVDWTGIGIYPQKAPRFHSGTVGPALADKTSVTMVCETVGETVSNNKESSDIWALIKGGGYLPNAFLNTGVNGRTPGVDDCGKPPATTPPPPKVEMKSFKKEYTSSGVVVKATYWDNNGKRFILPETTETVAPQQVGLDPNNYDLTGPLADHWFSNKGGTVLVPWEYFAASSSFMDWLRQPSTTYSPTNTGERVYQPAVNTDMRYAIGPFLVFKLMDGCYIVTDSYEFMQDKPQNAPYYPLDQAEKNGAGKRFGVVSSSC